MTIQNGLSVDVEEWFQVGAFERVIDRENWPQLESRVEANTDAVLALFGEADVKATFFTLGWVAEHAPRLIQRIVAAGHEIASHGVGHQRVFAMSPQVFRSDLDRAQQALEDAAGTAVSGYRAPSFSIDARTPWAHQVLADAGYAYSSSVAPIRHDHYGWPEAPRFAFKPIADACLVELPVTTIQLAQRNLPTGGGFFRLLPQAYSDWAVRQANRNEHPAIFYFHPWEIDPDQPRVGNAPLRSKLRHYSRLRAMAGKLRVFTPPPSLGPDRSGRSARSGAARMTGLSTADIFSARECARIDAFVRGQIGATPFHLTGWSRAVERGCAQRAHYLVAEDGQGAVCGVLPLTHVRSRLFGSALVSSGFAVSGGVLANDPTTSALLVEAAVTLAERLGCASLELRGGAAPVAGWQVDDATYVGFVRDLARDDDAELKAIPRKQRAEVRRALGKDLVVETGRSESDLAAHYAVYAQSVRNLGTPVFPQKLFVEMAAALGEENDILTVRHHGQPVASVFSFYFNNMVYPYWGGGILAARALRANDLMYYALMRHAAAKGCTRFDFGRSKVSTGAAAFKKNWGFEPHALAYAKRTQDGSRPREINPLSPRYRLQVAAWKKLPLWLANRIGPPIARGLG